MAVDASRESLDELVAVAGEFAMHESLAGLVEDAEVEASGVKVNPQQYLCCWV